MHPAIETRYDKKRGCGWRKEGGLYLVSDGEGRSCGRLPIVLNVCPTCGGGIHQTRGWTWVDGGKLAATETCATGPETCKTCPLAVEIGKVGLLWIGKKFYGKPADFLREAALQGISRRISAIPREFEVGKTWIWLAHTDVVKNLEPPPVKPKLQGNDLTDDAELMAEYEEALAAYRTMLPGVFYLFRPTRIEYVVTGKETDEEIDAMVKRGITPVTIQRTGETKEMFE
jgi:hypothetical protein